MVGAGADPLTQPAQLVRAAESWQMLNLKAFFPLLQDDV